MSCHLGSIFWYVALEALWYMSTWITFYSFIFIIKIITRKFGTIIFNETFEDNHKFMVQKLHCCKSTVWWSTYVSCTCRVSSHSYMYVSLITQVISKTTIAFKEMKTFTVGINGKDVIATVRIPWKIKSRLNIYVQEISYI